VDWPSYVRKVVSATAGAAAGAAVLPGGPVAMAAAQAAAGKLSDDLLAQFMGAHLDQMQRIEELNQEMRGRLIGLQNTVGGLLDAPWRTALAHIEEAGRRPGRREQELELARTHLFEAWGVGQALLDRDARSQDPAAMRCPLVAQQIAAVYGFLGEPRNTVHWLATAYTASRNQLDNQVSAIYDLLREKAKHQKGYPFRGEPRLEIEIWARTLGTRDPLWIVSNTSGYRIMYVQSNKTEPWSAGWYVERDLDFEGRLAALSEFDAEVQLLRRTCLDAGVAPSALPPDSPIEGARRVLKENHAGWYPEGKGCVLVVFNETTAACPYPLNGGKQSPLQRPLGDRYREISSKPVVEYFARAAKQ
jgi:hypothetical protein